MRFFFLCRELEAQVQDLREVCQTSAADRAAAASNRPAVVPPSVKLPPSLTPRSTIMTPAFGPVVLPGNFANIMVSGVSPPPRYDSSSSSSSPSPDRNSASNSRGSSKSSTGSDISGANTIRQWAWNYLSLQIHESDLIKDSTCNADSSIFC